MNFDEYVFIKAEDYIISTEQANRLGSWIYSDIKNKDKKQKITENNQTDKNLILNTIA